MIEMYHRVVRLIKTLVGESTCIHRTAVPLILNLALCRVWVPKEKLGEADGSLFQF